MSLVLMLASEVIGEVYGKLDGPEFNFPIVSQRFDSGNLSFNCFKAKHVDGVLVSVGYGEDNGVDEIGNCLITVALSKEDVLRIVDRQKVDMSHAITLLDYRGTICIKGFSQFISTRNIVQPMLEFVGDKDLLLHPSSLTRYDENFNARLTMALKRDLGIRSIN